MNNFFEEPSETEDDPCEELTTPGTIFTSPRMDTHRSPNTGFVNTVTQSTRPGVNASKHNDSSSSNLLIRAMSPAYKVNSWFASSSARPCHSSTSRLITRNAASTAGTGPQSQLSNQLARDPVFDPNILAGGTREMSRESLLGEENQQLATQTDASTALCSSPVADEGKLSASHFESTGPFCDPMPKRLSQQSSSIWNARAPTFDPEKSTRGHAPTLSSPRDKTETLPSLAQRAQGNTRPHLSIKIPNVPTSSESFRSLPQMAAYSKISDPQGSAPHTADPLGTVASPSTPSSQGRQCEENRGEDIQNPTERPLPVKFSETRALLSRDNHNLIQPMAASHTNSRTWTSNLAVERERWHRVEDSLGRMNLLRSSVVPKTLKDWVAHQRSRTDAKKAREQKKLEGMNLPQRDSRLPPPGRPVKIGPAFRERAFRYRNYGSVLPFPSVWAYRYQPPAERLDPLWPCIEEMKEEGDERNTSGFSRFPALPRKPGNDTVQYKLKPVQPFLPFDAVWKLPTKKSVRAAMEVYPLEELEEMEGFLGRSLLDALDCVTEDSF